MITVLLSLGAIFLILILSELLWNSKKLNGETGRKFVHITVGSFVAFWPFYMGFHTIQLISVAFLIVVIASRYLKIFHAVHVADRKTWGDVMFAVGIGLAAIFTKTDWIFMAAILHLSLADGLAALMGKKFGKTNRYKVLGHEKSVVGTLTFIEVSVAIIGIVLIYGPFASVNLFPTIIWLPLAAAALENVGIYGLDNVFVPILITLSLRLIS